MMRKFIIILAIMLASCAQTTSSSPQAAEQNNQCLPMTVVAHKLSEGARVAKLTPEQTTKIIAKFNEAPGGETDADEVWLAVGEAGGAFIFGKHGCFDVMWGPWDTDEIAGMLSK